MTHFSKVLEDMKLVRLFLFIIKKTYPIHYIGHLEDQFLVL